MWEEMRIRAGINLQPVHCGRQTQLNSVSGSRQSVRLQRGSIQAVNKFSAYLLIIFVPSQSCCFLQSTMAPLNIKLSGDE